MATRRLEQKERSKEAPRAVEPPGAFTLDEVRALVKVLEGTDVTTLRWDRNGQKIVIQRGHQPAPIVSGPVPVAVAAPHAAPAPAPVTASAAPAAKPEAKPGTVV